RTTRQSTRSTLSPYTTLFRSQHDRRRRQGFSAADGPVRHRADVGGVQHRGRLSESPGANPRLPAGEGRVRKAPPRSPVRPVQARRARRRRGPPPALQPGGGGPSDRKSTRLNSSHVKISYAVFCVKKKK